MIDSSILTNETTCDLSTLVVDPSHISGEETPMVSVGILAYNHEAYIGRAIESILMQEVNFNFEIVIAEDCSTDRTREIVLEYVKRYPRVVRLVLQKQNVGMVQNSKCLKLACVGKFRANCEGDDYWVNVRRMQMQVDFLEKNPEYIATGGNLICVNDKGEGCDFPWGDMNNTYIITGDYTKGNIEDWKLPCHSSTLLSHNLFYTCEKSILEKYESYQFPGDRKLPMFLMQYGKIHVFESVFMARRILWESKTSHINWLKGICIPEQSFNWVIEAERMDKEFTQFDLNMRKVKEELFLSTYSYMLHRPNAINLMGCMIVLFKSKRRLHLLGTLVKKIATKAKIKIKREGLFRACAGMFLYIFRTCKAIVAS